MTKLTLMKVAVLITMTFSVSIGFYAFHNHLLTGESLSKPLSNVDTSYTISAAQLLSNDTNWAGYIVASDLQNPQPTVTGVSASWTVPTVTVSSNDTFSAVWIGIGGFFDQTLIQTGTEQDSIQGKAEYSAWVELLPQTALTIDTITVSPGDQINASIQLANPATDEWSVHIKDITTNQEFSDNFYYPDSQLSAEWIVERPDVSSPRSRGTLAALADVGKVELTNCQATVGGTTGPVGDFPTVQTVMYETVENTNGAGVAQLAAVSDLTDNGSSFAVETSPSVIPELSVQMFLLLVVGTSLYVLIVKKRYDTTSKSSSRRASKRNKRK